MIITELRHTTKSVTRHQAICGFDDMSRCNADRHVHSDGAVPYWRLWSACFLGFGAIGMTMQVMPAYAHEQLGANAITAGLAVTIGSLATMFSRPISGRFADQSGGRRVAMAGAILGLIGGIGHVVAPNLPVLVLARLFLGAGEGALFTGSVGWILAHTEQSQRGKIAGHFGLAMWMGLASGPMLGTALMATGTLSRCLDCREHHSDALLGVGCFDAA